MAPIKPKRADLIREICNETKLRQDRPVKFSNGQLRELLLWIRQAKRIISENVVKGGVTDASN